MINAMPNPMQHHEMLLPNRIQVTPSRFEPWRAVRRSDQRYTNLQLTEMVIEGLDPETCDFVVVRSQATKREYWWGAGSPTPVFLCPSPIVERRGADKLRVISPAGSREWVYSDGAITRARLAKPKRRFG